ncbi:hypothetical protein IND94_003697 [Salmonella enterica]|nr:hypothetical protein [Salmonella enterica]
MRRTTPDPRLVSICHALNMTQRQAATYLDASRTEIRKCWPSEAPPPGHRSAAKPTESDLIRTLSEYGATVQLTARMLGITPERVEQQRQRLGITPPAEPTDNQQDAKAKDGLPVGGFVEAAAPDVTPEQAERRRKWEQRRRVAREAREMMEQERDRVWADTLDNVQRQREQYQTPEPTRARGSMTKAILQRRAEGMSDREIATALGVTDVNDITAAREIWAIDQNWQEAERRSREKQTITRPILGTLSPGAAEAYVSGELWGGARHSAPPADYRRR